MRSQGVPRCHAGGHRLEARDIAQDPPARYAPPNAMLRVERRPDNSFLVALQTFRAPTLPSYALPFLYAPSANALYRLPHATTAPLQRPHDDLDVLGPTTGRAAVGGGPFLDAPPCPASGAVPVL